MPSLLISKRTTTPPTAPRTNQQPPLSTTFAAGRSQYRKNWWRGRAPASLRSILRLKNSSRGKNWVFPVRTFFHSKETLAPNSSPSPQPNARKMSVARFCKRFIVTSSRGKTRPIKNRISQNQMWRVCLGKLTQGIRNNTRLTTTDRKFP